MHTRNAPPTHAPCPGGLSAPGPASQRAFPDHWRCPPTPAHSQSLASWCCGAHRAQGQRGGRASLSAQTMPGGRAAPCRPHCPRGGCCSTSCQGNEREGERVGDAAARATIQGTVTKESMGDTRTGAATGSVRGCWRKRDTGRLVQVSAQRFVVRNSAPVSNGLKGPLPCLRLRRRRSLAGPRRWRRPGRQNPVFLQTPLWPLPEA